jgi:hypothetical protein
MGCHQLVQGAKSTQRTGLLRLHEGVNPGVAVSNTLLNHDRRDAVKCIIRLLACCGDVTIERVLSGDELLDIRPDQLDRLNLRHERRSPHDAVTVRLQQLVDLRLIDPRVLLEMRLDRLLQLFERRRRFVPCALVPCAALEDDGLAVAFGRKLFEILSHEEGGTRDLGHLIRCDPIEVARLVIGSVVHHDDHLLDRVSLVEGWQQAILHPQRERLAVDSIVVVTVVERCRLEDELRCGRDFVQEIGAHCVVVIQHGVSGHGVEDDEALARVSITTSLVVLAWTTTRVPAFLPLVTAVDVALIQVDDDVRPMSL